MMLWSVMPEEVVFEHWDESFELQEKFINNRRVQVRVGKNGFGNIEGIISTNPKDFLDKGFCPGKEVRL